MIDFQEFISEAVLYRGVEGRYDPSYSKRQDIVWVSTSQDHAGMYGASGEVVKFDLKEAKLSILDLGFRASETQVKWDEIETRFVQALMQQFKQKKLSREKAMSIDDRVDELKYSGYHQIWEWMHKPEFLKLIKEAGFNAIRQREGLQAHSGETITYGILDQSLIHQII